VATADPKVAAAAAMAIAKLASGECVGNEGMAASAAAATMAAHQMPGWVCAPACCLGCELQV